MARIYYGSFLSLENIEYRVELWDAPSGSAVGGTELTLAGDGFTIERQGQGDTYYQNYIRPSRATTYWSVPTNTIRNAFINIANNEENKYAILIYRASSLFYVGRVVADQADYLRESIDGAPVFKLVGVDSLNLLDGFFVDPAWFTDGQITGLHLITKSLETCGLDDYWTHLSNNTYLRDGVTMYDTAQSSNKGLVNTKFSLLSFYKNFDPFSDVYFIDTTDPYVSTSTVDLISCKDAIDQVISIYGARMTHEAGAYWIVPDDAYNSSSISTRIYNASETYQSTGTTTHAVSLGGDVRPQWQAKPNFTYQPPIRAVDVIHEKQNGVFVFRIESDKDDVALSITDKVMDIGKPVRVRMLCKWNDASYTTLSGTAKRFQRYQFYYKIYFTNGSATYRQYSPNLNAYFTPTASPNYMSQQLTVTNTRNSYNTHVMDFTLPEPPSGFTHLYVEYYLEAVEGLYMAPNDWQTENFYMIDFWGTISVAQPQGSTQNPDFSHTTKQTITVSGAASGNSQLLEISPAYYDDEGPYGYGSIYVYNGTSWVLSSDWYSGYSGSIHDDLGTIIGKRIAGQYNKFVPIIQGTWHDAGSLTAIKSLSFDSLKWLFNGGTFNPRFETWDGEWIGLAPDYTVATGGTTSDYNPRTGERIINTRLNYHEFAITKLNLETSAVQDRVLEYLVNQADGAPTAQPTLNTRWEVMLQYTDSSEVLEWHVQEHNSPITYTAGSHSITNGYELIICDSSGGQINIDLPLATESKGKKYYFKKTVSSHSVVIDGNGTDIDDQATKTLTAKNETCTIISDGVQWWLI